MVALPVPIMQYQSRDTVTLPPSATPAAPKTVKELRTQASAQARAIQAEIKPHLDTLHSVMLMVGYLAGDGFAKLIFASRALALTEMSAHFAAPGVEIRTELSANVRRALKSEAKTRHVLIADLCKTLQSLHDSGIIQRLFRYEPKPLSWPQEPLRGMCELANSRREMQRRGNELAPEEVKPLIPPITRLSALISELGKELDGSPTRSRASQEQLYQALLRQFLLSATTLRDLKVWGSNSRQTALMASSLVFAEVELLSAAGAISDLLRPIFRERSPLAPRIFADLRQQQPKRARADSMLNAQISRALRNLANARESSAAVPALLREPANKETILRILNRLVKDQVFSLEQEHALYHALQLPLRPEVSAHFDRMLLQSELTRLNIQDALVHEALQFGTLSLERLDFITRQLTKILAPLDNAGAMAEGIIGKNPLLLLLDDRDFTHYGAMLGMTLRAINESGFAQKERLDPVRHPEYFCNIQTLQESMRALTLHQRWERLLRRFDNRRNVASAILKANPKFLACTDECYLQHQELLDQVLRKIAARDAQSYPEYNPLISPRNFALLSELQRLNARLDRELGMERLGLNPEISGALLVALAAAGERKQINLPSYMAHWGEERIRAELVRLHQSGAASCQRGIVIQYI